MSAEQAKQWLHNHSTIIPALAANQHIIDHLPDEEHPAQNLIQIAAQDLGLSLALLSKINAKRGSDSGRDIVDSPQAAIALLGDRVSVNLFQNIPIAEQTLAKPDQLFLFLQIINRSFHHQVQAEMWAKENGNQQIELLKVSAFLTYIGEALCCAHDFEKYFEYIRAGASSQSGVAIFGFTFSELTEYICQSLNLPELIYKSLRHEQDNGQREKILFFTSQLCQYCEHGWYSSDMQKTFQEFVDFLQLPPDRVINQTHQHSLIAARNSIVPEAWQPASRLVLIHDAHWTPASTKTLAGKTDTSSQSTPRTATLSEKHQEDAVTIIKRLLKQPDVRQMDLLNACLKGLFEDAGLTKTSLLLLSKDRQLLQTRIAIGIDEHSPFRNYRIDLAKSGIFKILLSKPQAVWINSDSFKKYQKLIPESFMANIMTNNFLAMSLFIGTKPIGIVYADRTDTSEAIDQQVFTQFKQLISLTSKALAYLSKK